LDKLKVIVVDGLYSMEGDLADLPRIVELAQKYNANILVDDAHGVGVFGGGKGSAAHFGTTEKIDLITGTFSKSLASIGGFVVGDTNTIDFMKHNARSLMFSASIAPANAASAHMARRTRKGRKAMGQHPVCHRTFDRKRFRYRRNKLTHYSYLRARQYKDVSTHANLARKWCICQSCCSSRSECGLVFD